MSKVSNRLKEVWEAKERVYEEVKDLPLEEALRKIVQDSNKAAEEFIDDKVRRISSRSN